jgi:hypothetical protein
MLRQWKVCLDLAGIRDRDALKKLPADEQKAWEALWKDIDALLKGEEISQPTGSNPNGTATVQQGEAPAGSRPSVPTQRPAAPANSNPDVNPDTLEALASLHKRAHELAPSRPAEAEPLFCQVLEGYRKAQGPDGALTLDLTLDLANLLYQSGRGAEAEPLIVAGYEGMNAREAKIPPPGKPRFTEAAERVVRLYEEWGKEEKAAEWRTKLAKPTDGTRNEP